MIDLKKINRVVQAEKILSSADATSLQPRLHQASFSENQSRYVSADDTREFNHRILKQVIKELPNLFRISRIHKSNPFHFPVTVAK